MRIRIKRLPHCFAPPEYKSLGAAGADLYSAASSAISHGQRVVVPLGIVLEIPNGYWGSIQPRSGMTKNGLIALHGTIDSDYRGEVFATILNLGFRTQHIQAGQRIAQLIISPVIQAVFVESDELSETGRGAGGFGSTGT